MLTFKERNEKTRAALARVASKPLNEEVEHFLSVDDDEDRPHDYYDAVTQACELAEDIGDRKVLVPARRVLIELGYYKEVDQDELDKWTCFSGSTGRTSKMRPDFRDRGRMYLFNDHVNVSDPESGYGPNDI